MSGCESGDAAKSSREVLLVGLGARHLCGQVVVAFGIVVFMACKCHGMYYRGSKCLPGVLKTLYFKKYLNTIFTTFLKKEAGKGTQSAGSSCMGRSLHFMVFFIRHGKIGFAF